MTPPLLDLLAGANLQLSALVHQLRADHAASAMNNPVAIAGDLDRIVRQLIVARDRIAPATPPEVLEVSLVDNVIPLRIPR